MNPRIESLEKMLDGPRDGALLRFSLGNEYLKAGDPAKAANSFKNAVDRDNNYSAAWKALGKALADAVNHHIFEHNNPLGFPDDVCARVTWDHSG